MDSFGDFVSGEGDRFTYDVDWEDTDGSPTAMVNPAIATEIPKFPQRAHLNRSDSQLWSNFAGQDFDYMRQIGNFGLPFEGRENAMSSQAKIEQHSNQSFLSQDTCLSTDHNAEISSVVSKSDVGYPLFSAAPQDGFVSFWQQ